MHPNFGKAVAGGFLGTVVMTVVMYFAAPMMLGRPMDVAAMLGSVLGGSWTMGMLMHFINGTLVFPAVYTYILFRGLPGAPWLKGAAWGTILWVLQQAVVMPMMGGGFFSANAGGLLAVTAALMTHALYGITLGGLAGPPEPIAALAATPATR